jgi:hypothetical protein
VGGNIFCADGYNPISAFDIQATLLLNNGIILSFDVNHIIMDGTETSRVIEIIADRR